MPVSARKQKVDKAAEFAEDSPLKLKGKNAYSNPSWGRASSISLATQVTCYAIVALCPLMVIYFWMACDSYQCSLAAPLQLVYQGNFTWESIKSTFVDKFPQPTTFGFQLFAGWLVFQCTHSLIPT
jgi:7-dehydrocholesterol reductase